MSSSRLNSYWKASCVTRNFARSGKDLRARAVANRLIAYRADHGLTQTALARLLGMSQSTIARLEIGEHIPTLPTLLKLSEVLDLEIMVTMTPAGQHRNGSAQELPEGRITEQITTSHGASIAIRSISAADYCASA
jgi:transcriptional regulator with XRE-family HTH domain